MSDVPIKKIKMMYNLFGAQEIPGSKKIEYKVYYKIFKQMEENKKEEVKEEIIPDTPKLFVVANRYVVVPHGADVEKTEAWFERKLKKPEYKAGEAWESETEPADSDSGDVFFENINEKLKKVSGVVLGTGFEGKDTSKNIRLIVHINTTIDTLLMKLYIKLQEAKIERKIERKFFCRKYGHGYCFRWIIVNKNPAADIIFSKVIKEDYLNKIKLRYPSVFIYKITELNKALNQLSFYKRNFTMKYL